MTGGACAHGAVRSGGTPIRGAERVLPVDLTFLLLCAGALLLSFFLTTDGHVSVLRIGGRVFPFMNLCFLKYFTGYNCPFCGMTRSFIFISHGLFWQAARMNPAGPAVYAFCLFESAYRLRRLRRKPLAHALFWRRTELVFLFTASGAALLVFGAQFMH